MPVPPRWRRRLRAWARRSSVAWWGAAAALVLVTALVVRTSVVRSAGLADRYGALRTVPVVAVAVDAGAVVDERAVRMERRPGATVPRGVASAGDVAAGRAALVPLVPGEVLLSARLAPRGLRGAAALLPPGMRAVAVPAGPAGRPPADVGDRVDVVATIAGVGDAGTPTVVVAAGALVVAIDAESDSVTIAVTPEELPAVVFAITAGTVTLALTSR